MDKNYESLYHSVEYTNWWFVARRDMLFKFFAKYKISKDARILDIGCAAGTFLLELKNAGYTHLTALDYSADAIARVKEKGITDAYVMDGHKPEFDADSFDVLISSDSLEHLENDQLALSNWYKILKPGGIGILLVPAYNFLWTEHDDINYHFRRYTKTDLKNKATNAGFSIQSSGYNYVLFFLPTAIVRGILRLFSKKKKDTHEADGQILNLPVWVNKAFIIYQKMENSVCKYISMPFGVSAFVTFRK
jgi:SAM-dependent methyltransferase